MPGTRNTMINKIDEVSSFLDFAVEWVKKTLKNYLWNKPYDMVLWECKARENTQGRLVSQEKWHLIRLLKDEEEWLGWNWRGKEGREFPKKLQSKKELTSSMSWRSPVWLKHREGWGKAQKMTGKVPERQQGDSEKSCGLYQGALIFILGHQEDGVWFHFVEWRDWYSRASQVSPLWVHSSFP